MTKTTLTVTSIIAALALAGPAAASIQPGVEHPELEAKLPTTMQVFVTTANPPATGALAWVWRSNRIYPEIYLTPQTYLGITQHDPLSMFALYHEWNHVAFQDANERYTNTMAIVEFRYMLRRYWGFPALQAQQWYNTVYRIAWQPDYAWYNYAETDVDPVIADGF